MKSFILLAILGVVSIWLEGCKDSGKSGGKGDTALAMNTEYILAVQVSVFLDITLCIYRTISSNLVFGFRPAGLQFTI